MRKIYVVGGSYGYSNWCKAIIVPHMEDANIVMFTGGEDVTPALYGKRAHYTTRFNTQRDRKEIAAYKQAKEMGLPLIGICRGSQLVCTLAGGMLVQEQNHPYLHTVRTNDGRIIRVTSTHHQRACIRGIEDKVELLAWAEHLSPHSFGESDNDLMDEEKECEIIYYKNINALGIQSHPEFAYPCKEEWQYTYIAYCHELLTKYLKV